MMKKLTALNIQIFLFQSSVLFTLSILYLIFFIKDSRTPTESSTNCCSAFSLVNVINVFKTCFKKRPGYERMIILFLIMNMIFCMGTDSSNLTYLFTMFQLHWNEDTYATFVAASSAATACTTLAFMAFMSYKLSLHDNLIGMLGALSKIGAMVTYAFATKTWKMYLGKLQTPQCKMKKITDGFFIFLLQELPLV